MPNRSAVARRVRTSLTMIALLAGLAGGLCGMPSSALAQAESAATAKTDIEVISEVRFRDMEPTAKIALLELEEVPLDQPPAMAFFFGGSKTPTIGEVLTEIRTLADDAGTNGLVLRLRNTSLPMTVAEEIGTALAELRAKGKKVHLFADNYETAEFYLGTFCDDLIVQSGGAVSLPGMYMEEMYLADTMSWVGLTPQFIQVGDYKGANETMTRAAPSPQWDQNINGLLDSIYGNVRSRLKAARNMSDAQLDSAMKQAWMATGQTAKELGLVDTVIDLPELSAHLEKSYGVEELAWTNIFENRHGGSMDISNPFAMLSKLMREAEVQAKRESIAVVHITGPIVDGDSTSGGMFGEQSVGSATIRRALEEVADEELIKGVVLRIDSPGGSAIASEVIWQGVKRVRESKPVWVSVGSMAASGGYYIAVSGQKIYLNPSSIVGSIGVVGGKIAMGGLYDKVKVNVVGRARGPMGDMMSSARPWTPEQQDLVRQKMKETYDLFADRVKAGRPGIELAKTAEGRLFTGPTAVELKMGDELGGLDKAVTDLASSLKLESGAYDVLNYPGPRPFGEVIGEMLGGMGASAPVNGKSPTSMVLVDAVRQVVGPKAWPSVRDHLRSLAELRDEPVLLTSPRALIFR